jgi:hypothetical protein
MYSVDSRIALGDAYTMGHRFWSTWVGRRNSELQAHAMALIELERAFMGLIWVKRRRKSGDDGYKHVPGNLGLPFLSLGPRRGTFINLDTKAREEGAEHPLYDDLA